jgi:hypothetical protein
LHRSVRPTHKGYSDKSSDGRYYNPIDDSCITCPEAKRFHERKKARTNNIVATKALAHKLARASYHILKEGKPFDVTRCFA